jgi:hypothetical protein
MRNAAEAAQNLKARRLHIDCVEMELLRNVAANAERYTGSGYIDQDDAGVITFRMYAATTENTSAVERLQALMINKAGAVYGDADFFTLRAKDYSGSLWTAERLLPQSSWSSPVSSTDQSLPCWSGQISILARSPHGFPDPINSLSVHFFEEIDLPFTHMSRTEVTSGGSTTKQLSRDYIEFEATRWRFHVAKSKEGFEVDVASDMPFPSDFEMRIVEALRFVTAHPLNWRVIVTRVAGQEFWRLSSEQKTTRVTALQRPLSCDLYEDFSNFWHLFGKYLEYVVTNSTDSDWNKCSVHLNHALEASANSADAWAVALCIAVEGCAGLVDWTETPAANAHRKALGKYVRAHLKDVCLQGTDFEKRATGLLGMLANPRLQDRLSPLVADGWVNAEHIEAWKQLRHPGAHGTVMQFSGLDSDQISAFLLKIHKASMLMHHLCFYLIGYQGPHTNYAMIGWPTVPYPLPRPTPKP